jgi:2-polyprenyl-3-methyl-5-hydroxy-6-metoxy-1,4-benzoquinol methylase
MSKRIKYILAEKIVSQLNRIKKGSKNHVTRRPEDFYKTIYLKNINTYISNYLRHDNDLTILDGGCGSGRIAIEVAKAGHKVTGVDYHRPSLAAAKEKAKSHGVQIDFIQGDLLKTLCSFKENYFDVGISIEVLYTCANYKNILEEYSRIIKDKGLIFATFNNKFYYITTLLLQKQYDKALYVAKNSEGILKIASIPSYYNWQTLGSIKKLYQENKFELLEIIPIGIFTGMGYDGMAAIANIEKFNEGLLNSYIYEIETTEYEDYKGIGRYLLAVGKKQDPEEKKR